MKPVIKAADRTVGHLLRVLVRSGLVHPLLAMTHKVTIVGGDAALSCENGSIVIPNHTSWMDAPFLMSMAWPHARIRPTAWYAEYDNPIQKPLMLLFSTIKLGSPKLPPMKWAAKNKHDTEFLWNTERLQRTRDAKHTMSKVLRAGHHLTIFAEGSINTTGVVSIPPHLSGVHDLIVAHPFTPVLMVKIDGLTKKRPSLFTRKPVTITITRFDAVSTDGGPPVLNAAIEKYFNNSTPLPTKATIDA